MERAEYERMAAAEDRLWWYRALHERMIAAWDGAHPDITLDAGCGTGGFLRRLARHAPGAALFGVELDGGAAAVARRKSARPVAAGSVERLPLAPGTCDAIVSADVLCHEGVDVAGALREFHRALKPGGRLILNLPAYPWLYSAHDRAVGNARRFTRSETVALLRQTGFARIAAHYWNSLLFPAMLMRRLSARRAAPHSEVELLPPAIDTICGAVAGLEAAIAKQGLRLPFGGSILAVAEKP